MLARTVAQSQLGALSTQIGRSEIGRVGHAMSKNAYRVEYPKYKIQLNGKEDKVVGFKGSDDDKGINISFIKPDHSEYFVSERDEAQQKGLRIVSFEISDDMWKAIDWRATGKTSKTEVKPDWASRVGKLKAPSWSDGKNLTTDIKQTALGFASGWLDVLIKGVVGNASVTYLEDDEAGWIDATIVWAYSEGDDPKDAGGEYGYGEAKDAGFEHIMSLRKAESLGYIVT